nr:hypothetical protein [Olsenella sp. oral taxon 809]
MAASMDASVPEATRASEETRLPTDLACLPMRSLATTAAATMARDAAE